MRLSPAATVGVLLSLALALPACGGERTATADKVATAQSAAKAGPSGAVRQCRGQLKDFLDSMDALRRELVAGLTYEDYLHEVRQTKTVYDGIPTDRVALGCLARAGTPGERALNHYLDAANTWGDCLAVVSCSSESVEPKLQRKWALASALLSSAQRALRDPRRS